MSTPRFVRLARSLAFVARETPASAAVALGATLVGFAAVSVAHAQSAPRPAPSTPPSAPPCPVARPADGAACTPQDRLRLCFYRVRSDASYHCACAPPSTDSDEPLRWRCNRPPSEYARPTRGPLPPPDLAA